MLALLRSSGWDPDYVSRCVPALLEALPSAPPAPSYGDLLGIRQAWDQYYPIGEPDDVPFGLGVLLYSLERYAEALDFFEVSLHDFGADPRTTLNLAMTSYRLGRRAETLQWLDRTLELDPDNETAHSMRPDVAAELDA